MKHGTNISLAWPVSLHMYHFILQYLELQAVSYFSSKLVGGWVYEHCYDMYWEGNSNENGHETWGYKPHKNETKIFHFYPHLTLHFPQRNAFVQRLTRARNNSQSMDNVWTDWGVARSTFTLLVMLTAHIRSYRKWNKLKFPCCSVVISM